MRATARSYIHHSDCEGIGRFLVRTYRTSGQHINWLQPRWEYMHYHPNIRNVDLRCTGAWEVGGETVGVVHPEHSLGTAYFEFDPGYGARRSEMLAYAEDHIAATRDGGKSLAIYINDRDDEFQAAAAEMGYTKTGGAEEMSHFVIPNAFPPIPLPEGFRLKSLAEDNDYAKESRADRTRLFLRPSAPSVLMSSRLIWTRLTSDMNMRHV